MQRRKKVDLVFPADLVAPFFGLSFKNVNTGRILMDATALASKHGLMVPAELILFFKSIVTVEGMGRELVEDFDILGEVYEISDQIVDRLEVKESLMGLEQGVVLDRPQIENIGGETGVAETQELQHLR